MNGNNLIIDTNIALYLLEGNQTIAQLLNGKNIYVSFITQLELLGFKDISLQEISLIEAFLESCIVIDVNQSIKELTISIRRESNIKLPDAIIAATSKYLNMPLISADTGFNRVNEIQFILYES
jgi:predicted nucleic acid-binding protein